ncbi:hypothetical protein [Peribacillus sp. NPDC101480]|uniref:hypothetical protein n=1 Tax=Peribacillus sp. NPDC101480 TaxID=3390620 RepID=UPI003D040A1A
MHYYEGTVIKKKNILFKGTDKIDFRMGGHPILLPIPFDHDDEYIYYLTLSSQVERYPHDKERYALVKKVRGSGLDTNSIVDLKYVYKCPKTNNVPKGCLGPEALQEVVTKFLNYIGVVKDSDCNELLALIP